MRIRRKVRTSASCPTATMRRSLPGIWGSGDAARGDGKERAVPAAFEPGNIVDVSGKVLGRHTGLVHYTIGQRKGIGVAAREPLYVVGKDAGKNVLAVGPRSGWACARCAPGMST